MRLVQIFLTFLGHALNTNQVRAGSNDEFPTKPTLQPVYVTVGADGSIVNDPRSTFLPSGNAVGVGGVSSGSAPVTSVSRTGKVIYAQNRDSYQQSGGYSTINGGQSGQGGSYATPAQSSSASSGGNGQQTPQGSMTYYYYYPPQQSYGGDAGGYSDDEFGSGGDLGLGGLTGLLGLKGLKGFGLGGLGLFALFKLLKTLALPLLFLAPLLLLFLPVPVITLPAQGRSLEESPFLASFLSDKISSSIQMATEVFASEECVERIACEISRKSRGTCFDKFMTGIFDESGGEVYLPKKWNQVAMAYMDAEVDPDLNSSCAKFHCKLYDKTIPPSAPPPSPPFLSSTTDYLINEIQK